MNSHVVYMKDLTQLSNNELVVFGCIIVEPLYSPLSGVDSSTSNSSGVLLLLLILVCFTVSTSTAPSSSSFTLDWLAELELNTVKGHRGADELIFQARDMANNV